MPKEDGTPTKEELLAAIDGEDAETNDDPGTEIPSDDYTEVEQEAMLRGWKPEGVEGKPNLSAEEFMGRQPFYEEIHSLKRETRKLKDGIQSLMKERELIRNKAREDTIKELQQQKIEAMDEQNHQRVIEIDDQIAAERNAAAADERDNASEATNTEFTEWLEDNSWYNSDDAMKAYADKIGAGIAHTNPNMSRSDIYEEVTKEVKAHFPAKFAGSRRGQGTSVEGAGKGRSSKRTSKYSVADLPEEAQQLMPTILRATGMTEEEYIKSYMSA